MTKDDIITLPKPHLREKSQRVGFVDDEIKKIVEKMKSATISWDHSRKYEVGVALAAVQIDKLYKIVIIRNNFDDKNDTSFTTFINPKITKFEGTVEEDYEGCLSVKDIYGLVPRHTKVRVKATNIDGEEFRVTAEGFLARVFQHEIDHTNGIVFIDHIKNNPKAFFKLDDKGELEQLDYKKDVEQNSILW